MTTLILHKRIRNFVFILLVTHVKIVTLQNVEGDSCILQNGNNGKCVKISGCPKALEELKTGANPTNCGFSETEPIVCCESNVKSKSEEKCEKFGKRLRRLQVHSIVGGEDAIATEFPHMAALGFGSKENINWKCGGSLISERFILTAAHCLRAPELGEVKFVRMGDIRLDSSSSDLQDFEVINRIRHPDYKPPVAYNDIALLELDRPAEFTIYVKPACLYSKPLHPQLLLTATGWGLTQYAGSPSNILQKVRLQLSNKTHCAHAFRSVTKRRLPNGILEDRQICAGSDEEKDTCQGDSGGPLQTYRFEEKLYGIVGTTAFGKACGTPDVPSVYSRVSYYVPWIESVVWPN